MNALKLECVYVREGVCVCVCVCDLGGVSVCFLNRLTWIIVRNSNCCGHTHSKCRLCVSGYVYVFECLCVCVSVRLSVCVCAYACVSCV